MIVVATLAMVALASATTYIVGDSANWDLPSSPTTYSDWAANKNFVVGDILGKIRHILLIFLIILFQNGN